MTTLCIPTAPVFKPLLKPARYLGAWGGRGSGKSSFFDAIISVPNLHKRREIPKADASHAWCAGLMIPQAIERFLALAKGETLVDLARTASI